MVQVQLTSKTLIQVDWRRYTNQVVEYVLEKRGVAIPPDASSGHLQELICKSDKSRYTETKELYYAENRIVGRCRLDIKNHDEKFDDIYGPSLLTRRDLADVRRFRISTVDKLDVLTDEYEEKTAKSANKLQRKLRSEKSSEKKAELRQKYEAKKQSRRDDFVAEATRLNEQRYELAVTRRELLSAQRHQQEAFDRLRAEYPGTDDVAKEKWLQAITTAAQKYGVPMPTYTLVEIVDNLKLTSERFEVFESTYNTSVWRELASALEACGQNPTDLFIIFDGQVYKTFKFGNFYVRVDGFIPAPTCTWMSMVTLRKGELKNLSKLVCDFELNGVEYAWNHSGPFTRKPSKCTRKEIIDSNGIQWIEEVVITKMQKDGDGMKVQQENRNAKKVQASGGKHNIRHAPYARPTPQCIIRSGNPPPYQEHESPNHVPRFGSHSRPAAVSPRADDDTTAKKSSRSSGCVRHGQRA